MFTRLKWDQGMATNGNGLRGVEIYLYYETAPSTFKRNAATQYISYCWIWVVEGNYCLWIILERWTVRNLIKLETLSESIRDFVMRYCIITWMLNGNNFHLSAHWRWGDDEDISGESIFINVCNSILLDGLAKIDKNFNFQCQ